MEHAVKGFPLESCLLFRGRKCKINTVSLGVHLCLCRPGRLHKGLICCANIGGALWAFNSTLAAAESEQNLKTHLKTNCSFESSIFDYMDLKHLGSVH